MRKALTVMMAAMTVAGCVGGRSLAKRSSESRLSEQLSAVMQLAGRYNLCSACPVEGGDVLTAAHCIDPAPFNRSVALHPMAYSDLLGGEGVLIPVNVDLHRDLGRMVAIPPARRPYRISEAGPRRGQRVASVGFRWDDQRDPLGTKQYDGRVVSVVAGHFAYEYDSLSGSSGGCVIDPDTGELLGINVWSLPAGKAPDTRRVGFAVGVWGAWAKSAIRAELPLEIVMPDDAVRIAPPEN